MEDAMSGVGERLKARQMVLGLVSAGVVAWTLSVFCDLWWPAIEAVFRRDFLGYTGHVPDAAWLWTGTKIYAVFGLPIAVMVCFIFGYPMWRRMDRLGLRSTHHAIRAGADAGIIIGLIAILFQLLMGLLTALDDGSSVNSTSYGQRVIVDGLRTEFGYLLLLVDFVSTVAIGAAAGVAAWWTALLVGRFDRNPHAN
jgi:hypothetical protein